jgi:hypothetical protein
MKVWSSAVLLLILAGNVRADVPGPRPKPVPPNPNAVNFVIQFDDKVSEAKLVIPKQFLAPKAKADLGTDDGTGIAGASKIQTIMAGLCLALALGFGGLWMVRHRGQVSGRALGLLLGAVGFLALSTTGWADFAPPVKKGTVPAPVPFPVPANLNGKVLIEVVEKGDTVRLIINRNQMGQFFGPVPQPVPPIRPLPAPATKPALPPAGGVKPALSSAEVPVQPTDQ